ncbi:hypothetical protein [Halovenus salina]|uniref:Uncharacterized protein n=1 Tax=Halovenus salina TaxID=1510225 RepID=A0ABD5WA39_9EURY|nr:hypothetical protein [Halovenus salina]
MSRTGPGYVESEAELFADLERKEENGEISERTANAFRELYEFAKEIGDEVQIGEAKNANFQVKVDAHQGESPSDTSVFTANVNGKLKIWPAMMVIKNDAGLDSVEWEKEDYDEFERAFHSLKGVPRDSKSIKFETFASKTDRDEFMSMVDEFVTICQERFASAT